MSRLRKVITVTLGMVIAVFITRILHTQPVLRPSQDRTGLTDSVFVSEYGGYGYDILLNGSLKIHQPIIPGAIAAIGFASKDDAQKTARLVISKLKRNQSPLVITYEEMKAAGVGDEE